VNPIEATFGGRLLVLGTGGLAHAVLPLLLRHVALAREAVLLLGPDADGEALALRHGVVLHRAALEPATLATGLSRLVRRGDMVLNLALGVDSLAVLAWCQGHDVLYLDTNLESWFGRERRLGAARQQALAYGLAGTATAVIAHGANPGLVTHFVRQILGELVPAARSPAAAAAQIGLRVVQVAEHDTHTVDLAAVADDEFANTWSPRGLWGELDAEVELGWGGHETTLPPRARLWPALRGPAAQLSQPGRSCLALAWTPGEGCFAGHVLAHHESMSIADLLTTPATRPTVFYAVRPCPAAWRLSSSGAIAAAPRRWRLLTAELNGGGNELGVLLLGERVGHWYGSRLSLAEARTLAPDNNATLLQVAAGVLGGVVWMLENPRRGVVEPEGMDHRRVLEVARPYLGELGGGPVPWRPDGSLCFEAFRTHG